MSVNDRTWDLSILYNGFDDPAFREDLSSLDRSIAEMKKLAADASSLSDSELVRRWITASETLNALSGKLFIYANLRFSANTGDTEAASMSGTLMNKLSANAESDAVLNKPFTIDDFLAGRNYSDFGSVFRNYFKTAGQKYHPLLLSSRNVCDFQDMFITQDFGPVFVMDRCFGVYRSRSAAGHSNYNSITTAAFRCRENIRLARAVEDFYQGKYDLSPLIRRNRTRLLSLCLGDDAEWDRAAGEIPEAKAIAAELYYLAWRGGRKQELDFLRRKYPHLTIPAAVYGAKRLCEKLRRIPHDDQRRGYRKE